MYREVELMQLYHDIDIHEDKHSIEEMIISRINTFYYLYHSMRLLHDDVSIILHRA